MADGTQLVTNVGSLTAIGSGYYLRVDGGQVVIVNKSTIDSVKELISQPPILATATPVDETPGEIEPEVTPTQ
jgi:hypothetical protein